jgi:hypothetical protein
LAKFERAELVEVEDLLVQSKELLALHYVWLPFKEVKAESADAVEDRIWVGLTI